MTRAPTHKAWDKDRFQRPTMIVGGKCGHGCCDWCPHGCFDKPDMGKGVFERWYINIMDDKDLRKCFASDNDGHWYLIDAGLRDLFKSLLEDIKDDDAPGWDLWYKTFEHCRCLPPTAYTFLDPKEE